MPLPQQEIGIDKSSRASRIRTRGRDFRRWLRDDRGATSIEYVVVAIALLAIAGAVAAALTTLGNDAVEQIPGSVSEAGG